jgi:hypothetical protein
MSPERPSRVTTTAPACRLLGSLLSMFFSIVTYHSLLTQDRSLSKLIHFRIVYIPAECLFKSRCPAVCMHVTRWEMTNEILLNLTLEIVIKICKVTLIISTWNIHVGLTILEISIDIIFEFSFRCSGICVDCTRRATLVVRPYAHLEQNWIRAYVSLKCNWSRCYSHYCIAVSTSVLRQARSKARELLTLCVCVEFFLLAWRSDWVSRSCGLRWVSRASFGYQDMCVILVEWQFAGGN